MKTNKNLEMCWQVIVYVNNCPKSIKSFVRFAWLKKYMAQHPDVRVYRFVNPDENEFTYYSRQDEVIRFCEIN